MKFLTSDYFNFRAHFATLNQLFLNTHWGFGPSKFGPDDDISFFVGIVQIFALIISPFVIFKTWHRPKIFLPIVFFTSIALFAIFMTHGKSDPVWTIITKLAYVQFPWRFLGLAILGLSFVLGAFANLFSPRLQLPVLFIGIVLLSIFNFRYYHFEKWFYWINDEQKLSGELYNLQVRAAVLDYLPNSAKQIPEAKAPAEPQILSGDLSINYFDHRSAYFATEVDVQTDSATLQFPVMYFPNWQVYHNREVNPYPFSYDNDYGLITIKLSHGHHLIQAFFDNTPLRSLSNGLTMISAVIIIFLSALAYAHKKKLR
jgi:hypothetical protein